MNDKIYEIIDAIEKTDIKKKLVKIKEEIKTNGLSKKLIEEFNEAKALYEKYGYNDDFIKAKIKLMKDPLIKSYLTIQNEINMLSLYINNKVKEITNTTKE